MGHFRPGSGRAVLLPLLAVLVLAMQLQRGAAEAHHNHAAPLTVETPLHLLPSDLALGACPGIVEDEPLESFLAGLLIALGQLDRRPWTESVPAQHHLARPPDAPRAPPLA